MRLDGWLVRAWAYEKYPHFFSPPLVVVKYLCSFQNGEVTANTVCSFSRIGVGSAGEYTRTHLFASAVVVLTCFAPTVVAEGRVGTTYCTTQSANVYLKPSLCRIDSAASRCPSCKRSKARCSNASLRKALSVSLVAAKETVLDAEIRRCLDSTFDRFEIIRWRSNITLSRSCEFVEFDFRPRHAKDTTYSQTCFDVASARI